MNFKANLYFFTSSNFLKSITFSHTAVSHNTACNQEDGITISFEAQEMLLERKWRKGVNKVDITNLRGRN